MNLNNKTVLVTGGAGFIGSNFILNTLNKNKKAFIINLDDLTYAGNLKNLLSIEGSPRYKFIKGNISNKLLVEKIFAGKLESRGIPVPEIVVHFAAESHVDRSIDDASPFIQSNIVGTQVLLDMAKKYWKYKDQEVLFVHVSTDEVYGTLGSQGFFTESSPLQPNSPYSATKAGSDMLVRAFYETYGFPTIITRCSNNYGPYQFPEKLIPLLINNILNKKSLPVYGKGLNIRDWLYVVDHCDAIESVIKNGKAGEVYNIGGNNEWANIDIVNHICKIMDKKMNWDFDSSSLITFVSDRPGHDLRYAIDASKIKHDCGWVPSYDFSVGIEKTIDWYLSNQEWLSEVTSGQYKLYYDKFYQQSIS